MCRLAFLFVWTFSGFVVLTAGFTYCHQAVLLHMAPILFYSSFWHLFFRDYF